MLVVVLQTQPVLEGSHKAPVKPLPHLCCDLLLETLQGPSRLRWPHSAVLQAFTHPNRSPYQACASLRGIVYT